MSALANTAFFHEHKSKTRNIDIINKQVQASPSIVNIEVHCTMILELEKCIRDRVCGWSWRGRCRR